jgi:hypothetical protein
MDNDDHSHHPYFHPNHIHVPCRLLNAINKNIPIRLAKKSSDTKTTATTQHFSSERMVGHLDHVPRLFPKPTNALDTLQNRIPCNYDDQNDDEDNI